MGYLGIIVIMILLATFGRTLLLQTVMGARLYNAHYHKNLTVLEYFFKQASLQNSMEALLKSAPGSLPANEEALRLSIVKAAAVAKKTFVLCILILLIGLAVSFVAIRWLQA